jgi:hypothetical protein
MARFWSDDFDMDLPRVLPHLDDLLGPSADTLLWTYGNTSYGRLNHPACWNTTAGHVEAFFGTDNTGTWRPPDYYTDQAMVGCTWREAVRDAWPHGYLLLVDGEEVWNTDVLRSVFLDLMFDQRGDRRLPAGMADELKTLVADSLRAATGRLTEVACHECPGCGQPGVPRSRVACKPCWLRPPADLRNAVNGSYYARTGAKRPDERAIAVRAHRRALSAALVWYRDDRPNGQPEPAARFRDLPAAAYPFTVGVWPADAPFDAAPAWSVYVDQPGAVRVPGLKLGRSRVQVRYATGAVEVSYEPPLTRPAPVPDGCRCVVRRRAPDGMSLQVPAGGCPAHAPTDRITVGSLVLLTNPLPPDHVGYDLGVEICGEPGRVVSIEDGWAMVDRGSWGQFGRPVTSLQPAPEAGR